MSEIRATVKMRLAPGDLDEATRIFEVFIAQVRAHEPEVLGYAYYVNEDRDTVQVQEHYADADAMLAHARAMDQDAARRLMEIAEIGPMDVSGSVTPALREALVAFGTVHYWEPLTER